MFDLFDLSDLAGIFTIGVAFAGGAWMVRSILARIDKHIARLDAELKQVKKQTAENQKDLAFLIRAVSRIEGHLFGGKPVPAEESASN